VNELLSRFRDGNVEAFEALFRQFQAEVYGWIVRIVRDPGAAEDLTVETFWRVYRSHHRFKPEAPFGPWARRIATNLAIDHLRRRRPEVELHERVAQSTSPDPILRQEMRERIVAAFRRLPLKLRVVALLSLVEERSHHEIAKALGTSEGAIKLRVFRAVRLLREQLAKAGMKP
jgi:RNA polymerase sigma-70 factor (ECF subfamily)